MKNTVASKLKLGKIDSLELLEVIRNGVRVRKMESVDTFVPQSYFGDTCQMIVIRFLGGLGNQLFQYALGRHLSLIHDRPLRFDISGYTATKPNAKLGIRVFGLDAFSVGGQVATAQELQPFQAYRRRGARGCLARLANSSTPLRFRLCIVERKADFWRFRRSVLTSAVAGTVLIQGYWQTEKYFEKIAETIRNDLRLKLPAEGLNAEMLSTIEAVDSVSVHVRHGDNATSIAKDYGVLPIAYYQRAIGLIKKRVAKAHFFVFSDDLDWAKENLTLSGPTTFVVHNGDEKNYEDLRLMAACRHHILGNSTFSWWGAWLGTKNHQIVYAPADVNRDYRDHYPPSWNLLPVTL